MFQPPNGGIYWDAYLSIRAWTSAGEKFEEVVVISDEE